MSGLLDGLFGWERMGALFTDRARLQAMLDFEAALARAEASVGVIPANAVAAIVAQCRADLFDDGVLASATALAGNPAIPLVKALTARVAAEDALAARYVHWGSTSQDVIDSGLMLQLRQALDVLQTDLDRMTDALIEAARAHRATPIVARTLLQHALPST